MEPYVTLPTCFITCTATALPFYHSGITIKDMGLQLIIKTPFQNEDEEKRVLLRVYNSVTETEFIL